MNFKGNDNGAGRPQGDAVIVDTVFHEFAESLGAAVDAKDPHTSKHSEEVAFVAHALAMRMGLSSTRADVIHVAAHLHDVGKIGVLDAVLRKPGPLTAEEWAMMRRHPVIGAQIIHPVKSLRECGVLEMVLHHHERMDGHGYPDGLRGDEIPQGARIIAVADSLSAMLQTRTYRPAMTYEDAYEQIVANAGRQFDPEVVEAFCSIHQDVRSLIFESKRSDAPRPDAMNPQLPLGPGKTGTFGG